MAWDEQRQRAGGYLNPHKVQRILVAHRYVCHLCGHDGATQVDHVTPYAEWRHPTLSVHDASNLAPAHGEPCATCGRDCHADKTKAEAARGRARAQAKRKAQVSRPDEKHPGSLQ